LNKYKRLYNEIYNYLSKKEKNELFDKKNIVNHLFEKFKDNLQNNKDKSFVSFELELLFEIKYTLNNHQNEMVLDCQYLIINQQIFDLMKNINKSPNNKIVDLYYIISCNKLIICNDFKKSILIGILSKNNIFIPEIILEYNEDNIMKSHFDFIKNKNYEEFKKTKLDLKKDKISHIKEKDKILGKVYLIDKIKYNNINNLSIYLKLLMNLYNNHEEIRSLIKENKIEKFYYIISKNYIEKIKELFNYNEFCKIMDEKQMKDKLNKYKDEKEIFKELKNNFDKSFLESLNNLDTEKIKEKLIKEKLFNLNLKNIKIPTNEHEKVIKDDNHKNLSYFRDFEIVPEKIRNNLLFIDLLVNDNGMEKIQCLISDNKLIIYPLNINKRNLIINSINNRNEYIPELLLNFNDQSKLNDFIIEINEKGYKTAFSKFNLKSNIFDIIIDEKKEGKGYNIKELNNTHLNFLIHKEIKTIINLFLFNYDLKNKIKLSEDNNKNCIFKDKCYLINKQWMFEYKKQYSYNKISNYLNNRSITDKLKIDDKGNINLKENSNIIYNDLIQKKELFRNYFEKDDTLIEKQLKKRLIDNGVKKLDFYDEFIIVNKELFIDLIINRYDSKDLQTSEKEYIINSGKILIF
jgi:hypothetical protein